MSAYRGFFKPQNPDKYFGNAHNIVYRSNWEKRMMKRFDERADILLWASEELSIPYRSPIDRRKHRYFPDFLVKMKCADNSLKTVMIEIKPYKQTQKPEKPIRRTRQYIKEVAVFAVNQRKWEAAEQYCASRGWEFQVITERDVNF